MKVYNKDNLGKLLVIPLFLDSRPDRPIPFMEHNYWLSCILGSPTLVGEYIATDADGKSCIECKYWITNDMYGEKMDLICGDPYILRGMVLLGIVDIGPSRSYYVWRQEETGAYFLVSSFENNVKGCPFPVKRLS